jgi:hypothetical protein
MEPLTGSSKCIKCLIEIITTEFLRNDGWCDECCDAGETWSLSSPTEFPQYVPIERLRREQEEIALRGTTTPD